MANCSHHEICGLDDQADQQAGRCILHSKRESKSRSEFQDALNAHLRKHTYNFAHFVFPFRADFRSGLPGPANFGYACFLEGGTFAQTTLSSGGNFRNAEFYGEADFQGVIFQGDVNFSGAKFAEQATFVGATFHGRTTFLETQFLKNVLFLNCRFESFAGFRNVTIQGSTNFSLASFSKRAEFNFVTFGGDTLFQESRFEQGVDFRATVFKGRRAVFMLSQFRGYSVFSSRHLETEILPIFRGVEVNFRSVIIDPTEGIAFRGADFSECLLLETDLRKVELTDVTWPKVGYKIVGQRIGVYDETVSRRQESRPPWGRMERLYRELKQNYEDRRDHSRAADFHYAEKEMRRMNPDTPLGLRVLLTTYWLLSGYSERYLRPLIWFLALLLGSSLGYMQCGLRLKEGAAVLRAETWSISLDHLWPWAKTLFYSFRVMTLLRPEDLIPIGYSKAIHSAQSLLGPLFLGLFGLAIRQRLRR